MAHPANFSIDLVSLIACLKNTCMSFSSEFTDDERIEFKLPFTHPFSVSSNG